MDNNEYVPKITIERFKIVDKQSIFLEVTFDGEIISINSLVKLANQLASALSDNGRNIRMINNY
jgi:hypothetical protein